MSKEPEGASAIGFVVQNLEATGERTKAREGIPESEHHFWDAVTGYYRTLHEAILSDKPIVATGLFTPNEIYRAMDIPYIVTEYHSAMLAPAAPDGLISMYDAAEGYGISKEVCSPHRIAIGFAVSKLVPRPSFIVSTATTCDQTLKLYEILGQLYDVPQFLIDSPFRGDEAAVEYGKGEIRSLIQFLEKQTGKRMDFDRLQEEVNNSSRIFELWEKISELRKSVPCPISASDALRDFGVILTSSGSEAGLNYFESRYREIKERVDRKEGIAREEKFRVAWLYVLPLFDLSIVDWMEKEYGAVIVMDTFGFVTPDVVLDPSDPIDYLARTPFKRGFLKLTWGPEQESGLADVMAKMCVEYKTDAAIVLAHWSCKQYCGVIKILKDQIAEQTGIPFLVVDGDILDARVVSSAQMRKRIGDFFETLEAREKVQATT